MTSYHPDNLHSPAKPACAGKGDKRSATEPTLSKGLQAGHTPPANNKQTPFHKINDQSISSPGIILSQAPTNGGSKKKGLSNSLF